MSKFSEKMFPMLEAVHERALAEAWRDHGDESAAAEMVNSHLRLVAKIAMGYRGYGLPLPDLISEGNVGMMQAINRFEPEKGYRLSTYAMWWIRAAIQEYILHSWSMVKMGTTAAQKKLFFNLRSKKKNLGWLTNDEVTAMAGDLGVDEHVVREMEGRMSSTDMAFDAPVGDDDERAYQSPAYFLEDHSQDPASQLEDSNWEADSNQRLSDAMEQLDERSRDILVQRWLGEEKATLHELAARYEISAERIRQLEKNAMKKIKTAMLEA